MEKNFILVIVLLGVAVQVRGNYLDSLSVLKIDQKLIDDANSAIYDLKTTLQQNFQCERSRNQWGGQWGSQWGGSLRSHRLLEEDDREERHFRFRGAHGDGGYGSRQPDITCQDRRQQSGIFSGLYKKVLLVSELLSKVKRYILQFNNVIVGNGNAVNGNANVVIGSRNSLTGNNDWVFASDYQSTDPQEGVLIIENYLIELTEIMMITYNPREVIHCIKKEDSNNHFRNFWQRASDRHRAAF